jgi:nicotinamide riboside kinase
MDKRVIIGMVKSQTVTGIVSDGKSILIQKELEKFKGQKVRITIEPVS